MILRVLTVCTVILVQNIIRADETTLDPRENVSAASRAPKSGIGLISDGISNVVDSIASSNGVADVFEGRAACQRGHKKHRKGNKLLLPMLVGFLLIKSILLPVALKGLAVLSGKAVVLSLMSLILAAIVGLRRVAQSGGPTGFSYDGYSKYRRKDQLLDDRNAIENDDPYRFYRDKRRKK